MKWANFWESAVRDGSDIYIFQQLAEAASRSKGRLLVVGILHRVIRRVHPPAVP